MTVKLSTKRRAAEVLSSSNSDYGLTLTYFVAGSNLYGIFWPKTQMMNSMSQGGSL